MDKLSKILVIARDPGSSELLLGKAVALARRFGARIDLMLADSTAVCSMATHCARLGCDDIVSYVLHGSGEGLTDVLLRRLRENPVDLVMKPRAARRLPGVSLDVDLVERSGIPVMLVGERPWSREPRFAATVDVSDREGEAIARAVVQAAGMIALGCEAGLDVLYSEREREDERLRTERAVHLARLVHEFRIGSERPRILEGPPERTLPPLVAGKHYDVLILGALTRDTGFFRSFHTLTAKLVDAMEGDVLLVDVARRLPHDAVGLAAAALREVAAHP